MNWTAVESVATVLLATFTAAMAWMTYRTIIESRKQHKDAYRPILVLASTAGVDPVRREAFLTVAPPRPEDAGPSFLVGGVLKNVGSGPALNASFCVRLQGIEGYGIAREIAPVQAGGMHGGKPESPLRIPVSFHRGFNDTDFQVAPGGEWKIILEYKDIFGQTFHTIHTKDPRVPWTEIGRGPAPTGESPKSRARRLMNGTATIPSAGGA